MPKRVVRLINRNPGIAGVLSSILFVTPAYVLWYRENNQTNEALECVVNSLSVRDKTNTQSRDKIIDFLDEFEDFLHNIADQTTAKPLEIAAREAKNGLKGVQLVTNAEDLRDCLGD